MVLLGKQGLQNGRLGCRELRGATGENIMEPEEAQCQFEMELLLVRRMKMFGCGKENEQPYIVFGLRKKRTNNDTWKDQILGV